MSRTYSVYEDLAQALEAFTAGRERRHVRIDGHVIDLVQAGHPVAPSRPEYEEPREELGPLAEPEEPEPAVECCRACGRPLIGARP